MAFQAGSARRWKIPLHALTAAGSISLLILIASVLAWNAYNSAREVLLSSVDESIEHVSRVLTDRINNILTPAETQIELLVNHELVHARTDEQRLAALPVVRAMVASNTLLDAIYAGYPDGEFILFRPLRDETLKRVFRAPAQATLMVQTQTRQADGSNRGQFRFYDKVGQLLSQSIHDDYVFDPRTRPWYALAVNRESSVIVDPYIFFTTRSVGTTLARSARAAGAAGVVVGLDVTLASLAHEITELRVTPGSRVAIVDGANRILVRDQGGNSFVVDDLGNVQPLYVNGIDVPALAAAAALRQDIPNRQHREACEASIGNWSRSLSRCVRKAVPCAC